ncbi:MAG: cell division protein ZapE [Thiotrichales bacterium]
MPLTARYQDFIQSQALQPDAAQLRAVTLLQDVHRRLLHPPPPPAAAYGLLTRLRKTLGGKPTRQPIHPPVRGAYLWGGVGRGKTLLMDLFFETLPFAEKRRLHFHHFMRGVHTEIRKLGHMPDPLEQITTDFARHTRVLCLDEFFVSDISDAMLLAGLLEGLFCHGVALVTTSNCPPDRLYLNGLQRARFLPAIELIKRNTQVQELDGAVDYRMRALEQAGNYFQPLAPAAEAWLRSHFREAAGGEGEPGAVLQVLGRAIPTVRAAAGVVWFDFKALCDIPRGTLDYLELANHYHTVLVSDVFVMDDEHANQLRRLLHLVDEFYDRKVRLMLSAAAPIEALYHGTALRFEFERLTSRLQEMQSCEYLAQVRRNVDGSNRGVPAP